MRPLPKRLVADLEFIRYEESGERIARVRAPFGTDYDDAIAAEIARRWNAHEALVAALKAAESAFDSSAIACGEAAEDEPEGSPIWTLAATVTSAEYRAAEIVRAALRAAEVRP